MAHTDAHLAHVMVDRDEEHLRLLGLFHMVVAGLNLMALIMFIVLPLVIGTPYYQALGMPIPPGGVTAIQERLIMGLLVGGLLTFIYALNGWSLKHHQNWWSCIILSCIECLSIPLGAILGISAILVLRRPSVKALFDRKKAQPTA